MSARPVPSPEPTSQQAEDAQYYRHVLHDLIDMGASLARQCHAQAKAEPDAPEHAKTAEAASQAFTRLARTVRQTILLARHVSEPPRATAAPGLHRRLARKRILRTVEDGIHREAPSRDRERLQAELLERLDTEDLEDDLAGRNIHDIIADIRQDLGLGHDPDHPTPRRTPADIVRLHAEAAKPPSPHQPAPRPRLVANAPTKNPPDN